MATAERTTPTRLWGIVGEWELRDLWLSGRGLALSLAFSLLVSVIAYLVATNKELNFLEQREAVNLTLQVAIAVGALLALVAAADAVSGERERRTLETLLLTPVPRLELLFGKLVAAFSVWLAAFAITIPYVWFLGRGVGIVGDALAVGAVVGTLLAVFLVSLGGLVSIFARSNRVSLSLSLFLLLALFAPTQFPTSAQEGWLGHKFFLRSTISNKGDTPASNLVAHLNILSLRPGVYVDPEDWSSHRTRYLGPIPAGGSLTLTWKLQAVNSGSLGVYIAVLPASGAPRAPTTGPTVHVSIARRQTLNSGGILPLALGIPSLLGALTLGLRFRRRAS